MPAVPAHTKLVRRYAWKELAKCLNPAATPEILFWVDYAASLTRPLYIIVVARHGLAGG